MGSSLWVAQQPINGLHFYLAQLLTKRLDRKFPISIRDSFRAMSRDGVDDVGAAQTSRPASRFVSARSGWETACRRPGRAPNHRARRTRPYGGGHLSRSLRFFRRVIRCALRCHAFSHKQPLRGCRSEFGQGSSFRAASVRTTNYSV